MQIGSIRNQNFGARLYGDHQKIAQTSIKKELPVKEAEKILSSLEKDLPKDYIITFQEPQPYSHIGRVFVENSEGVGVDVAISPVLNNKDTLARYAEAARYLASTYDLSRMRRGLHSVD